MKVTLKNIGMLDEAEFEVGDLTIICGENNTGKTYATYSLYGYLDFMRTIMDNMFFRVKRRLFRKDSLHRDSDAQQEKSLSYNEIYEKLQSHIKEKTSLYSRRIVAQVMAGKDEDFMESEFTAVLNISLDELKTTIKNLENLEYRESVIGRFGMHHVIYDDGLRIMGLRNEQDIDNYLEVFLDRLLNVILAKTFILSVERTGASIFQEELDFNKIAKLEVAQKMLKNEKIEFFDIQDTLREKIQLYPKPVRDNISLIRDIKEISKQNSMFKQDKDQYEAIFNLLAKVAGGKYKANELGILFQPKGSKKAYNIEIASSSVRSLLMLYYYILHQAQKNDILMIDEPELNLHPNNQILVARLLVLLVNAGIKVFITTHSDYIVRELSNCIMLNNLNDTQIEKFKKQGYTKECKLESSKLKAYLAKKIKGKNTLKEVKVDSKQGIFMETFDEPIDSQNDNQILIFEELCRTVKKHNNVEQE